MLVALNFRIGIILCVQVSHFTLGSRFEPKLTQFLAYSEDIQPATRLKTQAAGIKPLHLSSLKIIL
jgi:hypothetical protein